MKKHFERHYRPDDFEIEYLPIREPSAVEQVVIGVIASIILPVLSDMEANAELPVIA